MIPKPFSTVAVAIGAPFGVPDTAEDIVEQGRQELEERLRALEARCRALLQA